jgi:hypothetical protein
MARVAGVAHIENQEDIFTTDQLIQALNECPEAAFVPVPGMYIQDLSVQDGQWRFTR